MSAAKNSVKLQDGVLMVVQAGDQTYESVDFLNQKLKELSTGLTEVKILVDYREVNKVNIGARKAGLEVARHTKFDKMAFYGASPYLTGLINLLARSAGKRDRIHFANSRKEALTWLKQN